MATDYDAPRTREDADPTLDGGLRLDARRSDAAAATLTVDDDTLAGADDEPVEMLTADDLTITVVAQQPNEVTCSRCFLVHHRSRYARTLRAKPIRRDCT